VRNCIIKIIFLMKKCSGEKLVGILGISLGLSEPLFLHPTPGSWLL
jgi:hypothetical protein